MSGAGLYALAGVALVMLGLYGLAVQAHLLRKLLAVNILGSGVFLVLVGLGGPAQAGPDPVPMPWSSPALWWRSRPPRWAWC